MKLMEMIKHKWQDLKDWYAEIAKILGELLKHIIISLPKFILGILGFLVFIIVAMKIGWWVLPIYVVLLILGAVLYEKYIKNSIMQ